MNITYNAAELHQVTLQDPYYANAFTKEITYLRSLDIDRLLAGFREVKGLEAKASVYPGWENSEIKGHTLGHYLSAVSQAYASTNNDLLKKDIIYMIDELAEAQLENGYLFASGDYLFDNVENRRPAWVPWYTMHKIFEGILLAYQVTGYKKAYDVMDRLADWVYERTSKWDEELNLLVLRVEYGGMNDCLYEVYTLTGKEEHQKAAHKFDEMKLFQEIHAGNDILNDLHANTTIPKFVGAMKRYMVVDHCEPFYLEACESFWDMVVHHHSYITGGNSEWEHFGLADHLEEERSSCNCETCNTYNMLKLSKGLYQITGKKKYLDFYDNTITNAILSSQNPETGMTMYFQPMATGYFKVYSTPFDKFWCCTGTGMENFTKLNDAIYFTKTSPEQQEITIARYISSELMLKEIPLKLKLEANYPEKEDSRIRVTDLNSDQQFILKLRIPDWSKNYLVEVNGTNDGILEKEGFLYIDRTWKNNDVVNITWKMEVTYEALPDNKHSVAFKYGPVVLSAGLGTADLEVSKTGVDVTIPTKNMNIKDYILIQGMSVDSWLSGLSEHLVKKPNCLEFVLKYTDEDKNLIFTPHYKRHEERYGIYFVLFDEASGDYQAYLTEEERKRQLELDTIDLLPVGNDQYELLHEVAGDKTFADTSNGFKFRGAEAKGYFSYLMKVNQNETNELQLNLAKEGAPIAYAIYVDDSLLIEKSTPGGWPPKVYMEKVIIPKELVLEKNQVTVKFVNRSEQGLLKLYGLLRMIKKN